MIAKESVIGNVNEEEMPVIETETVSGEIEKDPEAALVVAIEVLGDEDQEADPGSA